MLTQMSAPGHRIWRLRKRHQSIDAVLIPAADSVELRFLLNGELLYVRRELARLAALQEAADKRAELEREGWMPHW